MREIKIYLMKKDMKVNYNIYSLKKLRLIAIIIIRSIYK